MNLLGGLPVCDGSQREQSRVSAPLLNHFYLHVETPAIEQVGPQHVCGSGPEFAVLRVCGCRIQVGVWQERVWLYACLDERMDGYRNGLHGRMHMEC